MNTQIKSNKIKVRDIASLSNFKKSIERTNELIHLIIGNITATESTLSSLSKYNKKIYEHPIAKSLKVNKNDKEYIFELGFIALFANFETFMHKSISDLIINYPKSIEESEQMIKVSEVISMGSGKKIKEYIIDNTAIENSFSIDKWETYLKDRFNVTAFPDKKFKEQICILNELRNLYLHSGGITNSLFSRNMKKYFKSMVPINHKISSVFNRKKYFHILTKMLFALHKHLLNQ